MQATDLPEARALLASLPTAARLVRDAAVSAAWASASDLPGYTVGGVAGHLVRAAGRLEPTLDAPPPTGREEAALTDWYLANRVASPEDLDGEFPRFLRDDGEELGRQGPGPVAAELEALGDRLGDRLAREPADRYVLVILTEKAVPLRDYLATRVLEVVVHADDVATGAGIDPPTFDEEVVEVAVRFLVRLARVRSGDVAVLRALTRQGRVDDPYDVLRVL